MGKRLLLFGAWFLLLGGTAWAQESVTPAVLNEPVKTVSLAKEIIARIDPSYETVCDVYNGECAQGASGALYQFTSRDIPIASLRMGATTGMSVYGAFGLDLKGIGQRYIPQAVAQPASVSPLNVLWGFVSDYGHVSVGGGYSWDHEDPTIVLTAGVRGAF